MYLKNSYWSISNSFLSWKDSFLWIVSENRLYTSGVCGSLILILYIHSFKRKWVSSENFWYMGNRGILDVFEFLLKCFGNSTFFQNGHNFCCQRKFQEFSIPLPHLFILLISMFLLTYSFFLGHWTIIFGLFPWSVYLTIISQFILSNKVSVVFLKLSPFSSGKSPFPPNRVESLMREKVGLLRGESRKHPKKTDVRVFKPTLSSGGEVLTTTVDRLMRDSGRERTW